MKCPSCENAETKVIDSRNIEWWLAIRRRRVCEWCDKRFTTYEKIAITDLFVTKRDGTKEIYDRDKLKKALVIAYGKKNFSIEKIDEIISFLENKWSAHNKEISSKQVWRDVLDALKTDNDIAYIRFASVFMEFESSKDFLNLIRNNN